MAYLSPLRLHFAGRFQAAVSTVNNDPQHFDNKSFAKPDDQELGTATNPGGWWNPTGDAAFRLISCKVTSAFGEDGAPAAPADPVRDAFVADSDRRAPAKLVDLDPEQQLVSMIFGLEVRICNPSGASYVRGNFDPAPFADIWRRAVSGGGDINAGSTYQSVIEVEEWGDVSRSPVLRALQAAAKADGLLSIKFNVDGYNMDFGGPDFTFGRVVGTIGPASASEPRHMLRARQFLAPPLQPGAPGFYRPKFGINFCPAVVDEAHGRVLIDLGNALPTASTGGPVLTTAQLGKLALVGPGGTLGEIGFGGEGWYESTGGVVTVPSSGSLSHEQLDAIRNAPLALELKQPAGQTVTAAREAEDGLYVRADQFVFRLDPGEPAKVRLYATRFGQPHPNATVLARFDEGGLQMQVDEGDPPIATPVPPPPAEPEHDAAIDFPPTSKTGPDGVATVDVPSRDPQNPRGYIDGQIYGVRVTLQDAAPGGITNPFEFISFLVWDDFKPSDDPPTWYGTFQPIFQQYANLYPVMYTILDLGKYEDVCANLAMLVLAFGLDPADPNSMPVTRDLSSAKRSAILAWLQNLGPDGKPLLGKEPATEAAAAPRRAAAVPATARRAAVERMKGGKEAAMNRRVRLATVPLPGDAP